MLRGHVFGQGRHMHHSRSVSRRICNDSELQLRTEPSLDSMWLNSQRIGTGICKSTKGNTKVGPVTIDGPRMFSCRPMNTRRIPGHREWTSWYLETPWWSLWCKNRFQTIDWNFRRIKAEASGFQIHIPPQNRTVTARHNRPPTWRSRWCRISIHAPRCDVRPACQPDDRHAAETRRVLSFIPPARSAA